MQTVPATSRLISGVTSLNNTNIIKLLLKLLPTHQKNLVRIIPNDIAPLFGNHYSPEQITALSLIVPVLQDAMASGNELTDPAASLQKIERGDSMQQPLTGLGLKDIKNKEYVINILSVYESALRAFASEKITSDQDKEDRPPTWSVFACLLSLCPARPAGAGTGNGPDNDFWLYACLVCDMCPSYGDLASVSADCLTFLARFADCFTSSLGSLGTGMLDCASSFISGVAGFCEAVATDCADCCSTSVDCGDLGCCCDAECCECCCACASGEGCGELGGLACIGGIIAGSILLLKPTNEHQSDDTNNNEKDSNTSFAATSSTHNPTHSENAELAIQIMLIAACFLLLPTILANLLRIADNLHNERAERQNWQNLIGIILCAACAPIAANQTGYGGLTMSTWGICLSYTFSVLYNTQFSHNKKFEQAFTLSSKQLNALYSAISTSRDFNNNDAAFLTALGNKLNDSHETYREKSMPKKEAPFYIRAFYVGFRGLFYGAIKDESLKKIHTADPAMAASLLPAA